MDRKSLYQQKRAAEARKNDAHSRICALRTVAFRLTGSSYGRLPRDLAEQLGKAEYDYSKASYEANRLFEQLWNSR